MRCLISRINLCGLMLLQLGGGDYVDKLPLPLLPLVRAVERALARGGVQHLRRLRDEQQDARASRALTPVATFMMCGLSFSIT
jgi:hypothetical protein